MSKKNFAILGGLVLFSIIATFGVTSFVWYTNKEANTTERIRTGFLEVEFFASEELNQEKTNLDGEIWNLKTEEDPIFDFGEYFIPGEEITRYIKVENNGNVDLDFFIEFIVKETSILAEVIELNIKKINPNNSLDFSFLAQNIHEVQIGGKKIKPEAYEIYEITVIFPITSDNKYNLSSSDLGFEFDLFLYAWESNETDSNNLDALLESINAVDDWRRLKFVLPQSYLDLFGAESFEFAAILESRVMKDILTNKPETNFSTISHFNSIFYGALELHSGLIEITNLVNTDFEMIDKTIFVEALTILSNTTLSTVSIIEGTKDVEDIIIELNTIVAFIDSSDEERIVQNALGGSSYSDYYEIVEAMLVYINS